jgi:hypothetical protein
MYFEEVIKLYKKYIEEEDSLIEIKKKIDEEKIKSETELDKINSNAFLLIKLSKQKQKLIDIEMLGNSKGLKKNIMENWETGFTYKDNLLNLSDKNLNYEDYNLIFDEFEKVYNEILIQLEKDRDYDDSKIKELIELKGICLGSMAKIKIKYQKETDSKYNKLIDKCIQCARGCSKDNDDCEWYKEALELQKEIELKDDKNGNDEEEIKKEAKKSIDSLLETFEEDEERFIDDILNNFPFDGYDKYKNDFNKNEETTIEQIELLIKKYDPDKYPRISKKEKILYKIVVFIAQKLNEIKSNKLK